MAINTDSDLYDIQVDSDYEENSELETNEVYSSDVDSDESDDESSAPEEQSVNRNWSKTAFEPRLFHFDEQNSGLSSNICIMKGDTPLDFFELLFDEKMIDSIVKGTNKYQVFSTKDITYNTLSHQLWGYRQIVLKCTPFWLQLC
jgi:hypothetical protein